MIALVGGRLRALRTFAPEATALRGTLEKLLDSETFARSERARKLLRYLVEQEQSGQSSRLKGFSIAVDVFGKDADFDPSTDAVVRVQAGRLRDLLDQYFATEGVDDPVRIVIPRGSYVPTYAPGRAAEVPGEGTPDLEPLDTPAPPRTVVPVARARSRSVGRYLIRQVKLFWMAIAVVIAMLGFVSYNSYRTDFLGQIATPANAAPASRMADAIVSLPKVFVHASAGEDTEKVGVVLRMAVSSFDTAVYIARKPPAPGDAAPLDFLFDVVPGAEEASVDIVLQNVRSGQVIMSRTLSPADLHPRQLEDQIADLVSATLPVSGAVYSYLEMNSLQRGLTECLLLNDDYYLDQSSEKHKAAFVCFEKMRAAGAHSPLIYSEMAALELEAVSDRYDYPPNATKEQALEFARKAIQMAPTSPYAHRAYGFLYAGLKNKDESVKWMKKAYELGRFDLSMAAAYGYALILAGRYVDGSPVLEHAVDTSSARPSWWDYGLFLGEYMLDRNDVAADATDALTTSKRSHYIAARLIAAKLRNDETSREQLLSDLVQNYKKFAANPRAAYEKAGYPADLVEKLLQGLRSAGLAGES
ncbi:MAG: tetratricopeptide repeat protein [Rhizobiaceae bacterium]